MSELTRAMARIAALRRDQERDGGKTREQQAGPSSSNGGDGGGAPPGGTAPEPVDAEPIDVFISYAMPQDEALAAQVEAWLKEHGYKVWRATGLLPGTAAHREVQRALRASRTVVILWTPNSIGRDWCYSEAISAYRQEKLIPMCSEDVDFHELPPPFGVLHTLRISEMDRLGDALTKFGVAA